MKINEDLLPISIDKTINTDKRINFIQYIMSGFGILLILQEMILLDGSLCQGYVKQEHGATCF